MRATTSEQELSSALLGEDGSRWMQGQKARKWPWRKVTKLSPCVPQHMVHSTYGSSSLAPVTKKE
jgi:hypothetical protein